MLEGRFPRWHEGPKTLRVVPYCNIISFYNYSDLVSMDFSPVRMMVRSVVPFIVHTHTIFIAEEGSFSTYT